MTDIWTTAMCTGHRPQHLRPDDIDWINTELTRIAAKLRDHNGTETLASGFALGTDLIWANAAKTARLRLRAHIPFPQQPNAWSDPELRWQWRRLLDYAKATGGSRVYGDCPPRADSRRVAIKLLHERNAGMIEETVAADGVCVAVLRSSKLDGGTRSAFEQAKKRVPIVRLDPDRRTVTISRPENHATSDHRQETLPI